MPCCQRDLHTQSQMGLVAKSLGISEDVAIDVARLGGVAARGYDCRWRTIDAAITPKNRILIGLGRRKAAALLARQQGESAARSAKLAQIYKRGNQPVGTGEREAAADACGEGGKAKDEEHSAGGAL